MLFLRQEPSEVEFWRWIQSIVVEKSYARTES
nr:MAG TPA: hypothetical protein [Bacteriophage sp.]